MDGLDVIRLGTLLELPEMLMKLNYVECTLPQVDKKSCLHLNAVGVPKIPYDFKERSGKLC
jgi:hypothetical protein